MYRTTITMWITSMIFAAMLGGCIIAMILMMNSQVQAAADPYFFTEEVQEFEPVVEPIMKSLGEYRLTAYCPCEKCCGIWAKNRPNGIVFGAYGIELKPGFSVASPLPKGTEIIIDGLEYTVQDKIAKWVVDKYEGKVIDFYFETHSEAEAFGLQYKEVFVKGE